MFNKFKTYKHKNNTDVAFAVTNIQYNYDDAYNVYGVWRLIDGEGNLTNHIMANDVITIRYDDFINWELMEENNE